MEARGSFDDYLRSPSEFTSQGNQRLKLEWRREWALYLHLLPPFFVHMEERNTFRAIAVNTHSRPDPIPTNCLILAFGLEWIWADLRIDEYTSSICFHSPAQIRSIEKSEILFDRGNPFKTLITFTIYYHSLQFPSTRFAITRYESFIYLFSFFLYTNVQQDRRYCS